MEEFTERSELKQSGSYLSVALFKIVLIILFGSVMVYGFNSQASRSAYFLFVLIWFFFTKDNVVGIAILFILTVNPWGLFYYKPYNWIIQLTTSVGIGYSLSFPLIIFLKYYIRESFRKKFIKDSFSPFYLAFAFYYVFLAGWGLVFGHSAVSVYDTVLSIAGPLLFFVIPVLFSKNEIIKLNRIILSFSILHVVVAIADILTGGAITRILIFGREASTAAIWTEEIIRLTGGIVIALYSLIMSLYYLASRDKNFRAGFLWIVAILSFYYIINSATRGWMIASFLLVSVYFLFYAGRLLRRKEIFIGLLVVIIIGLVLFSGPIKVNIKSAFRRLSTVEAVVSGDLTAGGTARRWDQRGPRALTRFSESPIFGFGFSRVTSEYYDGHVGNHSLLLIGGIAGLTIIWGTAFAIIIYLYRKERRNRYLKGVFVFGIALLAIMIIHSTSRVMVSFIMPVDIAFMIALFLSQVNTRMNEVSRNRIIQNTFKSHAEENSEILFT
ncbi:MAG: O-antigen ligase family protein [Bacteroidales bacterium]|nr:O-antigen ligase family protein [Bacteroidales bacterium]